MRQIKLYLLISIVVGITQTGCHSNERALYSSSHFQIYPDHVEQGQYKGKAVSSTEMTSNYQSSHFYSSVIQFRFSLNGKDNELPYRISHEANIFPQSGKPVIVNAIFGQQQQFPDKQLKEKNLPQNTRVIFRLDFRPVLNSFKKKGYYESPHGKKIYSKDFQGVFIAGNSYPLNWDFENLPRTKGRELKDLNGDGIYEIKLTFNPYDPDAHVASHWQLKSDLSGYPSFSCSFPLLNAVYNLSLDELKMNIEADSTFRTGEKWAGVWTRDVSYSTALSLAMLEPEVAKISLMKKVKDGRIIQDTGTGGAWPVSSDRIVWALAAWKIYEFTGDKRWLKSSYAIIRKSVESDMKTIVDPETGLMRGESSFMDWRKQTYPSWMEPADIYFSLDLSTNAVYYKALTILGKMADQLGEKNDWKPIAALLKRKINSQLWNPATGYYGQYLYGRKFRSLSPRAEALGEAFSVLFDIADSSRKQSVLNNVPLLEYGIPCIYPETPNRSPYHNNASWPFVQAFWTLAAAREKNMNMVAYSYATQLRAAGLFLTNKENMVAQTGDFAGTVVNSNRQLWSIAGQLAMTLRVLFGLNPAIDGLHLAPVIPKSFAGSFHLNHFHYRKALLSLTVKGWGNHPISVKLDGKLLSMPVIPGNLTGEHSVDIIMNKHGGEHPVSLSKFKTAPDTPILQLRDPHRLEWTNVNQSDHYQIFNNGKIEQTTMKNFYTIKKTDRPAEYQVMTVAPQGTMSFLSNPVALIPNQMIEKIEAENFNYPRETTYKGFSGKGYVEFNLNNQRKFRFRITVPRKGHYWISFRYANGSGPINTDNKCGIRSLYRKDQFITSLVFPQRGKDEWSNWGWSSPVKLLLAKGTSSFSICFNDFNTNMNGQVNRFLLDCIKINSTGN